jgi:hypothetical protein
LDFVDGTMVSLADAARRNALLDQAALAQMTAAAFDVSTTPLEGPFALDVETAELGLELAPRLTLEGSWTLPGGMPTDARFRVEGLRLGDPLRIEALWRGRLIARTVPQDSRIEEVTARFAATDIDKAIVAALGALPADPAALEAARRNQLRTRLTAGMAQPAALDDAALDDMLARAGVASVGALLAAEGAAALGAVRVRFSAPAPGTPASPVTLPVIVAVLVRNVPLPLAALFAETRAVRAALAADPTVTPAPAPIRRRASVLVLWVVPAAAFDDADWPGADRAARRGAAGELLAAQEIGLAVRAP